MVTPISAAPPLAGVSILPRSSGEPKRTLANIVFLHLEGAAFQPIGHAGLGVGTPAFRTVGE